LLIGEPVFGFDGAFSGEQSGGGRMISDGESLLTKGPGVKGRASLPCLHKIARRSAEGVRLLARKSTRVLLVEDRSKDARTLENLLARIEGQSFELTKVVCLTATNSWRSMQC
jgi:hypothetical protein